MLLPLRVAAEHINVYPDPDEDGNYLYDYGEVEVGTSSVMIFQIENDPAASSRVDWVENAGFRFTQPSLRRWTTRRDNP